MQQLAHMVRMKMEEIIRINIRWISKISCRKTQASGCPLEPHLGGRLITHPQWFLMRITQMTIPTDRVIQVQEPAKRICMRMVHMGISLKIKPRYPRNGPSVFKSQPLSPISSLQVCIKFPAHDKSLMLSKKFWLKNFIDSFLTRTLKFTIQILCYSPS